MLNFANTKNAQQHLSEAVAASLVIVPCHRGCIVYPEPYMRVCITAGALPNMTPHEGSENGAHQFTDIDAKPAVAILVAVTNESSFFLSKSDL